MTRFAQFAPLPFPPPPSSPPPSSPPPSSPPPIPQPIDHIPAILTQRVIWLVKRDKKTNLNDAILQVVAAYWAVRALYETGFHKS